MIADTIPSTRLGSLDQWPLQAFSFRLAIITFIEGQLASWLQDPLRQRDASENALSEQLCRFLNSVSRKSKGFDGLQFNRESRDEYQRQRTSDLSVSPLDDVLLVDGRQFTKYDNVLALECKRLPTPRSNDRDEREYLYSKFGSRGGIQRFKAGLHASQHRLVGMIGYIQVGESQSWLTTVNQWIDNVALEDTSLEWSSNDHLAITRSDVSGTVCRLTSVHSRRDGLQAIRVEHLWVQMQGSDS